MMKEEEEAVTSNGMNVVVDDNTNNIYSTSDSDNNRIDDCNLNQISQVWGTWEELLLTCAVKRHGFMDWDSVSKEVCSRSSLIASAGNCRIKYQDLKRRFQDSVDGESAAAAAEEDKVGEITWLEQLRSLRVAELRRDVQRCDDSILSLQLKVKKLEEEKDGDDGDKKPDLEDDESKPVRLNRETTESDRENRSMNESNSTGSVDKTADHDRLTGDKSVKAYVNSGNPDPDPVRKAATEKEEGEEGTVSRRSEMSNSGELGESGTSTGHKKRKGAKYRSGEDSSNRGGDIKSTGDKSQPLIEIIKLIRSHPRGSVFEYRLRSQETKDYKSLIRQHLDMKTIEKKLEKGSYVSSSQSFYRDIKLLFTNAIVFFPTSSSESMAAHELRTLVSNEMKKQTGKSGHIVVKADAESSVSRQKSSVLPLVACKKPKKMSPSPSFKQKDEKKSQEVVEEKTVNTTTTTTTAAAAARSSRRTSKGNDVVAKDTKTGRAKNNSNKKQTDSKTESSNDDDDEDKEDAPKTEKKIASDKKKSVADFLKRIKKNSPQKAKETTSKDQKKKKSDVNVKKEAKPRELRSNSTGKKKVEVENNSNKSSSKRKQPKKEAEEVATATGKRGRESGKDNKQQPKKRSRR